MAGLAALIALLAVVPGAGARSYLNTGSFDSAAPNGVAVDQTTGNVYVAQNVESGVVNQYDASGSFVKAYGPVGTGTPSGVAIDPTDPDTDGDHNLYVYFMNPNTARKVVIFDTGSGTQLPNEILPSPQPGNAIVQIGMGANSNDVFLPFTGPAFSAIVKKFDPDSATPETAVQEIKCTSCPGTPGFTGTPLSVAVDTAGNIYVPDLFGARLIKFGPAGDAGPTPVIIASLAPTQIPTGTAINPSNNDVFVTVIDAAKDSTAVSVYDSNGNHITDFGAGVISGTGFPSGLAVNENTGVVYAADKANGKIHMFTPVEKPAVTTEAANGISPTAATLNATVDPEDESIGVTDCHFEWGTTTAYGETAPCDPDPGIGTDPVQLSAALAGLSPSTTYHFRIVAENPGGVSEGDDEEFTTLAQPAPLATTEAASAISQTKATLNAKVDAEGDNADCSFEYGTTVAYGKTAACSVDPVTGTALTAVTAALSGLSPNTTYHYRVVAENSGGTTNGSDMTFSTPADTCATNAALCPPPPVVTPPVTTTPPPTTSTPPPTTKKPLKCKKGFKKKTVKGKQKCVKVKKKKKKK